MNSDSTVKLESVGYQEESGDEDDDETEQFLYDSNGRKRPSGLNEFDRDSNKVKNALTCINLM
jgi:hypothetical protein